MVAGQPDLVQSPARNRLGTCVRFPGRCASSPARAENVAEFKKAVEGRIQAFANVHRLFVESRWAGAELHELVTEELAPYRKGGGTRVNIEEPKLLLEPNTVQIVAVVCHKLAANAANASRDFRFGSEAATHR